MKHIPVLINAIMRELGDIRGCRVLDATFGAGGYTRAFLDAGASVVAFDRDPNVVADADAIKSEFGSRFRFIAKPFSAMCELNEKFDAIVFDLGISSMQIDIPTRGFSFRADAPLDMRMSGAGPTAAELIAQSDVAALAKILRDYGDVARANVLARAIINAKPQTTFELKNLIYNPRDVAPVFQALRIAVNDEMGELRRALSVAPEMLNPGGKCLVVTFHSIEDRIVKNTFRDLTTVPGNPLIPVAADAQYKLIRAITPDENETEQNPRSRSAHLRGVQKSY
ncbi:MAG: 16S rRNA (cytosine(1402)-N(4))-methyltransferase RsmH [Alphaproteobacteria bacterium]